MHNAIVRSVIVNDVIVHSIIVHNAIVHSIIVHNAIVHSIIVHNIIVQFSRSSTIVLTLATLLRTAGDAVTHPNSDLASSCLTGDRLVPDTYHVTIAAGQLK